MIMRSTKIRRSHRRFTSCACGCSVLQCVIISSPFLFLFPVAGCFANVLDLSEIFDLCVARVKDEFERYNGKCVK
jgi:hypothetical protein